MNIGIFYGSSTGNTEMAANLHRYEWWIAGGLGLGAALIFGIRWLGARRPARL